MKRIILNIFPILGSLLVIYLVVFAWSEPVSAPPGGNVPAPINIGPNAQSKAGDLEVNDLKARGGINLGNVYRTTWPEGGSGCNWEGVKCNCLADTASVGSIRLVISATCSAGQLTNVGINALEISSRSKDCDALPSGCTDGLYTRN